MLDLIITADRLKNRNGVKIKEIKEALVNNHRIVIEFNSSLKKTGYELKNYKKIKRVIDFYISKNKTRAYRLFQLIKGEIKDNHLFYYQEKEVISKRIKGGTWLVPNNKTNKKKRFNESLRVKFIKNSEIYPKEE